jgi:hypothetical protein
MGRVFPLAVAITLVVACSVVAPARADEPSAVDRENARMLMDQASLLEQKRDLKGALDKFLAADAIMHVPTTGLEVGRAYTALGMLIEGHDTFVRVSHMPADRHDPVPFIEARTKAIELAAQLEPRIPTLQVALEGVPEGVAWSLTIDGTPVPAGAAREPHLLDPGRHVVVARAGRLERRQDVALVEHEAKKLTLDLREAPTAPEPVSSPVIAASSPPAAGESRPSGGVLGGPVITWGAFGVAGAAVVVGSIEGLVALSRRNAANGICRNKVCPPPAYDDLDAANTSATVSTVAFAVGIAAATVGVVNLVIKRKPPSSARAHVEPWVGAGAAGVWGRF